MIPARLSCFIATFVSEIHMFEYDEEGISPTV